MRVPTAIGSPLSQANIWSSSLSEWGDVRSLLATRCMGTWVDVRTGNFGG